MNIYIVQQSYQGIPQEPEVFTDFETARIRYRKLVAEIKFPNETESAFDWIPEADFSMAFDEDDEVRGWVSELDVADVPPWVADEAEAMQRSFEQ